MKVVSTIFLGLFLFSALAGAYEMDEFEAEGPALPNICYDTLEGGQFCTGDGVGNVQVLVYNAGWCGPCNSEMKELAHVYPEFEGEAVIFASLSGEGWSSMSKPNAQFLGQWKAKHNIPFVVAGKYRDFGKAFQSPGTIPFAVIVDKNGNVVKKGFMSGSQIASRVRQLLQD